MSFTHRKQMDRQKLLCVILDVTDEEEQDKLGFIWIHIFVFFIHELFLIIIYFQN